MSGIDDLLALAALQNLNKEKAIGKINEERLRDEIDAGKNRESIQRIKSEYTEEQLVDEKELNRSLRLNCMAKEHKIVQLERRIEFYEGLLKDNLETIAANSESFKEILNKERDRLSTWMVSQKGFMDVANEFGLILGYSESEVQKLATERGFNIANGESELSLNISEYSPLHADRIKRIKRGIENENQATKK